MDGPLSESKNRSSKKMPYVGDFATLDLSYVNQEFTVLLQIQCCFN